MLKEKHRKGVGQSCVWLSCALGPLTAVSQPRSVLQHTAAPPLALRSGSAAWLWAGLRPAVLTSHGSARPPPPPGVHVPQVRVRLHRRGDRGFQVRAVLRGDGELLWQKGAALSRHQRLPLLPHSASQPPPQLGSIPPCSVSPPPHAALRSVPPPLFVPLASLLPSPSIPPAVFWRPPPDRPFPRSFLDGGGLEDGPSAQFAEVCCPTGGFGVAGRSGALPAAPHDASRSPLAQLWDHLDHTMFFPDFRPFLSGGSLDQDGRDNERGHQAHAELWGPSRPPRLPMARRFRSRGSSRPDRSPAIEGYEAPGRGALGGPGCGALRSGGAVGPLSPCMWRMWPGGGGRGAERAGCGELPPPAVLHHPASMLHPSCIQAASMLHPSCIIPHPHCIQTVSRLHAPCMHPACAPCSLCPSTQLSATGCWPEL